MSRELPNLVMKRQLSGNTNPGNPQPRNVQQQLAMLHQGVFNFIPLVHCLPKRVYAEMFSDCHGSVVSVVSGEVNASQHPCSRRNFEIRISRGWVVSGSGHAIHTYVGIISSMERYLFAEKGLRESEGSAPRTRGGCIWNIVDASYFSRGGR